MSAFKIIGFILTLLIVGFVVYFFAFTKAIPLNWVKDKIPSMATSAQVNDFEVVNQANNTGVVRTYKKFAVTYNGETSTKTLTEQQVFLMEKIGKDAGLRLHYEITNFGVENGVATQTSKDVHYYYRQNDFECIDYVNDVETALTGTEWKNAVLDSFKNSMPLDVEGNVAYAEFLQNNLNKVTQKGFMIDICAEKDGVKVVATYDFLNMQLKKYAYEVSVFDGDKIVEVTSNSFEILFPKEIKLPSEITSEQTPPQA